MTNKTEPILRLEKILQRFGDSPEEANIAFGSFRRVMETEGIKAVDLRLDIAGGEGSSADALLRAFDRINTPTKQRIGELERNVTDLEKANSKLRAELKVKSEEIQRLRSVKRNYDRSKARKAKKAHHVKAEPAKQPELALCGEGITAWGGRDTGQAHVHNGRS
jgi:hypothetical protein